MAVASVVDSMAGAARAAGKKVYGGINNMNIEIKEYVGEGNIKSLHENCKKNVVSKTAKKPAAKKPSVKKGSKK